MMGARTIALGLCMALWGGMSSHAQWRIDPEVQNSRAQMIELVGNFIESPGDDRAFGYWNQRVASAGREDLIAAAVAEGHGWNAMICRMGDPLTMEALTEKARATSIVIVGEDHAKPAHRQFMARLAEALSDIGYDHYAAETFAHGMEDSAAVHTVVGDGYYTREPVYAAALNRIRALGYSLLAYEQTPEQNPPDDASMDEQIIAREQAQTDNLLDGLLRDNPQAKLLIHVGHAHVQEFARPGRIKWMAERLKAATGIDPLTISLSDCRTPGDRAVLADYAEWPDGTGISRAVDHYVGFPDVTFSQGRPDYRRHAGYQAIPVPPALRPVEGPVLLEARRKDAGDTEVPLDRLYLRPDEDIPLMLKAGTYDIRSFDEQGLVAGPVTVSVPD